MNDTLNFSISMDGLLEKGNAMSKEVRLIKEALNDINDARSSLSGWVSINKDKFDNRIANMLVKIEELTEVIESYSQVALKTSERAKEVEYKISNAIDGEILS